MDKETSSPKSSHTKLKIAKKFLNMTSKIDSISLTSLTDLTIHIEKGTYDMHKIESFVLSK